MTPRISDAPVTRLTPPPARTRRPISGDWVRLPACDPLPWRAAAPLASRVALVASDLFALGVSLTLVLGFRYFMWGSVPVPGTFWAGTAVWLALRAYMQLYLGYGLPGPEELRRSSVTTAVAALAHASTLFAMQETDASRFVTLGIWLLVIPTSWGMRGLTKSLLIKFRLFGRAVVVVGAGAEGQLVVRELKSNQGVGLVPVGFFDDDKSLHGSEIDGVPVLGGVSCAVECRFPYPISHAIVAMPGAGSDRLVSLSRALARRYPQVNIVPDLFGIGHLWVRAQPLGACLTLELQHDRFEPRNLIIKRAFDLVLGVPLFLIAAPLVGLAALLVRLISPGPAFFNQKRDAVDGHRIKLWKIRTMVPDAEARLQEHLRNNSAAREEWDTTMKLRKDPRVIPWIGAFLRRSSMDELPQLWNVIKGEMSLVGPRPFPEYHLERFSPEFRDLRCQVLPGITGLWQVTSRSDGDLGVQETVDSFYIHNWSLWLDLWILIRTFRVVLMQKGAY